MRYTKILLFLLVATIQAFAAWTGGTSEPESTRKIGGKIFYEITTPEELAWFALQVNSGSTAINAVLANDIVFGRDTASLASVSWIPIGKDTSTAFEGVLDGRGFAIYGMKVQDSSTKATDTLNLGLFGVIARDGWVQNLSLQRASVYTNDSVSNVGLIAGYSRGNLRNISAAGSVTSAKGNDHGGSAGGIAGRASGVMDSVSFMGDSVQSKRYAGGIVGYATDSLTISNSTNAGAVSANSTSYSSHSHSYSGGFVGDANGTVTISHSTNAGTVSANSTSYSTSYSGGFVGYASSSSTVTISNSQNSGNITGTVSTSSSNTNLYSYVGGFIGWSYKGQILDSYNTGSVRAKDTSAVSPNSSYRHLLYAGGLAGYLDSGMTIKNAYSATDSVSYSFKTSNSYTVGYAGALVGLSKGSLQNVYFDSDSLSLAAIGSDSSASKINVGGFSTANMQRDLFAWQLNSTGGTEENSKIWSRNGGYPIFADAQNKAIYKVVFDDEGVPTNRYSNNKGVVQFPETPEPASGYVFVAWLDTNGNIFSEKSTLSSDKKVSAYYALESDSLYIVDFMDTEGNLWASRPTNAAGGLDSVPEPPAPDSGFYFIGWFDSLDSRVEPTTVFTGNTTLSAKYSKLTIVFLNADGDTLQNSVAKYGSIPKYMGKTPTKASTTEYDYTFYGWNPNLATATEPATYTAVFDSSLKTFMVTFRNGFTTLQSTKVGYGATPAYNGNTPTKPSSTQYDYTFKGWSPSIVPVTGNAIYTAVFDSTAISQGSSSSVAQSSSSAIASSSSAMQSSSSMIASSSSVSSSSFGIMSSSSAVVQSSSSAVQSSSSVIASSSSEAPSSSSGVSNSSSSATDAFRFSAHPRFNLHVQNRTLQIQNARIGSAFAVLDLQGRVLRRGVVNSPEFSMELQNAGAYIVRVGKEIQKIRVK